MGRTESIDNLVSNVAKVNQVKFGSTVGNLQTITADTYQTLHTPEGCVWHMVLRCHVRCHQFDQGLDYGWAGQCQWGGHIYASACFRGKY